SSVTSFTPRPTNSLHSATISPMPRLRSAPRVYGTMQNVQYWLHPCMMLTNAVTDFDPLPLSPFSRIVSSPPPLPRRPPPSRDDPRKCHPGIPPSDGIFACRGPNPHRAVDRSAPFPCSE